MTDSHSPQVPEQLGHYQKIGVEPLGRGGMGVVWHYRETGLSSRDVAIKFLNIKEGRINKTTLMREIQALASLPPQQNIIAMLAVIEDPLALVMEYVPGNMSLRNIIKQYPFGIPIGLTMEILSGILTGISHAHEHGVFHRDIKPENVLIRLAQDGQPITGKCVKIVDFGISKIYREGGLADVEASNISSDDSKPILTLLGAYTEAYAAPEQINGEATGAFTDIYQIGAILYEMLSGARPFSGKTSDIIAGHCYSEAPAIGRDDIPPVIRDILATAMNKAPEKRYQSAGEMSRALADLGDIHEMNDKFSEDSSTRESATIRAGIKQKRRPGHEPPAPPKEVIQDIHQRAERRDRPNVPNITDPAAKKSGLKYAIIAVSAVSGIAAIAAVMYFSGVLGLGKSKPKTPSVADNADNAYSNASGIGERPLSERTATQSTPQSSYTYKQPANSGTIGASGTSVANATRTAQSSQTHSAGTVEADSQQNSSQTSGTASGGKTPAKTLGIGETIGSLAGAAVHGVSQVKEKEKQNIGSIVDKGLGFVTGAISSADNITYRPPQPEWPQGVTAARQDVRVQVQVGTDGLPSSPRVLGSPPSAFHASAIDYAMRHRFRQRTDSSGAPMTYSHTIVAQFRPAAN